MGISIIGKGNVGSALARGLEELQRRLPGARIVTRCLRRHKGERRRSAAARPFGFDAIDAGPLANARRCSAARASRPVAVSKRLALLEESSNAHLSALLFRNSQPSNIEMNASTPGRSS